LIFIFLFSSPSIYFSSIQEIYSRLYNKLQFTLLYYSPFFLIGHNHWSY